MICQVFEHFRWVHFISLVPNNQQEYIPRFGDFFFFIRLLHTYVATGIIIYHGLHTSPSTWKEEERSELPVCAYVIIMAYTSMKEEPILMGSVHRLFRMFNNRSDVLQNESPNLLLHYKFRADQVQERKQHLIAEEEEEDDGEEKTEPTKTSYVGLLSDELLLRLAQFLKLKDLVHLLLTNTRFASLFSPRNCKTNYMIWGRYWREFEDAFAGIGEDRTLHPHVRFLNSLIQYNRNELSHYASINHLCKGLEELEQKSTANIEDEILKTQIIGESWRQCC